MDKLEKICFVSARQLDELCQQVDGASPKPTTKRCVLASLLTLALDPSWDQLEGLMFMAGFEYDEKTFRRDFSYLAGRLKNQPICNAGVRFHHMVPELPLVTALVDGSVIPCRVHHKETVVRQGKTITKDATFSGKHRRRCIKIEWWVTMQGLPIAFRGPVVGSRHDAKDFNVGPTPFPHLNSEVFLGDLGYLKCLHVLAPYKKARNEELRQDRRYFNRFHAKYRSRIERFFAWLDKFRFFSSTDHDLKCIGDGATILINVWFALYARESPYGDAHDGRSQFHNVHGSMCGCWDGVAADEVYLGDAARGRFPHGNLSPMRRPRNGPRGAPATYPVIETSDESSDESGTESGSEEESS